MDGCFLHLDNTASTDAILNTGHIRTWLSETMVYLVCNMHINLTALWECESIKNILP